MLPTTFHGADTMVAIEERTIELVTGTMSVRVDSADYALDDLCGFAARRNPKRGFLFVSKVLGKHIPVRPQKMREAAGKLAAKIDANLPGPVVFFGMAETAICLGQLVFDEYVKRTGRSDVLFIHSTRYRLNQPVAIEFLEPHSHAAEHIIYQPQAEEDRRLLAESRSHVYVDDEASTGKTFVNLANAWSRECVWLEKVVTVVLTDWRGPARAQQMEAEMPLPMHSVSLLSGEYSFTPKPDMHLTAMPKAVGAGLPIDHLLQANYGRLGFHSLDNSVLAPLLSKLNLFPHDSRCLVLGTGEHAYLPFRFAEAMERAGFDEVHCQSTSRSPIMEGMAIGCSLRFHDNYGDGIDNFVYNARRSDYDYVFILSETPQQYVDSRLVLPLGAVVLEV